MSQPQVHTCPLPPEPPSHLPPHPPVTLLPPARGNQGALSAPRHILSWPTWPIRYILFFPHHHRGSPLNFLPLCIKDLLLFSFPKVFPHSSLRSYHSLPIAIKLLLTISDTLPQSLYILYPLPSFKVISTFVGTYYGSTLLPGIKISISYSLLCNKLLLNISSLSQPFITSQLLQVKNQEATYWVALAQGLS